MADFNPMHFIIKYISCCCPLCCNLISAILQFVVNVSILHFKKRNYIVFRSPKLSIIFWVLFSEQTHHCCKDKAVVSFYNFCGKILRLLLLRRSLSSAAVKVMAASAVSAKVDANYEIIQSSIIQFGMTV